MLVTLSFMVNRGQAQLRMLLELCDNDMNKLMKLEAYQNRTFKYACPADKEEVNKQVLAWEKLREEDRRKK